MIKNNLNLKIVSNNKTYNNKKGETKEPKSTTVPYELKHGTLTYLISNSGNLWHHL